MIRRLLAGACALLLLAGLLFFLRPSQLPSAPAELALNYHLLVQNGVVAGPSVLVARQGHPVRITLTADRVDRMHLHGYEIWVDVIPNQATELVLDAEYSGRYLLELEEQGIPLASLEVYP